MSKLALSVVVPVSHAGLRLDAALEEVATGLRTIAVPGEVVVAAHQLASHGRRIAAAIGTVAEADADGYGPALRVGLERARGDFILTVDPECRGIADAIDRLWKARDGGAIVVGSRFVSGAHAWMPLLRTIGSRALNKTLGRGLSTRVSDLSSAFRLYRADVLRELPLNGRDYDLLPEILVRALANGWPVHEVPLDLDVMGRLGGSRRVARLVSAYARTFGVLWLLRNSIHAADYDARAYDSIIPLQRFWQRRRFRHVTELIRGHGAVLDVGCGSSRIIGALPPGSVALDVLANKMRYARRFTSRGVRASAFHLPFADGSFPCVLCSQVIEHVPRESPILDELIRVLAPGGRLVLGTPDYARWEWVYMEKAYGFFKPGGYADEHITHYTRDGLLRYFEALGFRHEATRYILRGELILAFTKPVSDVAA